MRDDPAARLLDLRLSLVFGVCDGWVVVLGVEPRSAIVRDDAAARLLTVTHEFRFLEGGGALGGVLGCGE